MHIAWGLIALWTHMAVPASSLFELNERSTVGWGALILIVGGVMALWAASPPAPAAPWRLLLLLPQEFLVVLAIFGSVHIIALGHYADGNVAPRWELLATQLPFFLIWLSYLWAVALHGGTSWRRR
jgi:hypothetical protein